MCCPVFIIDLLMPFLKPHSTSKQNVPKGTREAFLFKFLLLCMCSTTIAAVDFFSNDLYICSLAAIPYWTDHFV